MSPRCGMTKFKGFSVSFEKREPHESANSAIQRRNNSLPRKTEVQEDQADNGYDEHED